MPTKGFLTIPFLDPKLDPNHPIHRMPPLKEDPHAPLGKRQRARILKEQLEEAIASYTPPHVPRSWEVDSFRSNRYHEVMALELSDDEYDRDGLPSLLTQARLDFAERSSEKDSSASRRFTVDHNPYETPEHNDFRRFAMHELHLGYHRFHLSTHPTPGEIGDSVDTPPEEVCWIMEYTDHECMIIRRKIALILGVYPAATDPTIDAYDEEIAWRYERRLHTRCRRRSTRCIRPSHIEIFTPGGQIVP